MIDDSEDLEPPGADVEGRAEPAARAIDLEPGQRLVLSKHGIAYYDPAAGTYAGPLHVVGSVFTFLRRAGELYVVRDARGGEGHLYPWLLGTTDPRVFFAVDGRELSGYLVDGMYLDHSGGSLTTLNLEAVPGLGAIELDARAVSAVVVAAPEQPITVHTTTGEVYCGRPVRLWLVCPTLKLNLTKGAGVTLRRVG